MITVQRWALGLLANIGVLLLSFALAPILPFFASESGWLPHWLWWFQTPDNSLDGDGGWKTEHWQWRYRLPAPLARYVGRVGWLWRNPGYGFDVLVLGASVPPGSAVTWTGDPTIRNTRPARAGRCYTVVTAKGGQAWWNWLAIIRLGSLHCLYLNFGWKLKTFAEDPMRLITRSEAQFVASVRINKFEA